MELSQELGNKRGFIIFGRRGRQLRKSIRMTLDYVEIKLERWKLN